MRSLATAALGLVVVLVHAEAGGVDLLPDPLGWLLVLLGLHDLRGHPRHRRLAGLARLALAVSVVLWWPGVVDDLYDADPALVWAVTLPQLACCALLAHTVAGLAGAAGDHGLRTACTLAAGGFVAAAALPVLVLGAGVDALEDTAYVVAGAALLLLVVLLALASRRDWPPDWSAAAPPDRSGAADEPPATGAA